MTPRRCWSFGRRRWNVVVTNEPGDWVLLRDPAGSGPLIGLQQVPQAKILMNRLHIDLEPTCDGTLAGEVRPLTSLGAEAVRYVVNRDEPH